MGCCLTLIVVPLLLLAPPQRATLQGQRHRHGAGIGRVRRAELARLSKVGTIPVDFADLARSTSPPVPEPTPKAIAAVPATSARTGVENAVFRPAPSTTTTTPAAPPAPAPRPVATADAVVPAPRPVPVPSPRPIQATTAGLASWYGSPAGTCASPSLAFGTVLTVTDVSTGASTRCTVDHREAHNPGRVVDLSPATFSELASLSVGVIEVRISW